MPTVILKRVRDTGKGITAIKATGHVVVGHPAASYQNPRAMRAQKESASKRPLRQTSWVVIVGSISKEDLHEAFVSGVDAAKKAMDLTSSIPASLSKRILAFQRPFNWDYEGGKAIRRSACMAAIDFIHRIKANNPALALPRVSPSNKGAIALTWRSGEQSLTVFFSTGHTKSLDYHWEGPNFTFGIGQDSREHLINRILSL
jgi:hypothetical protein